MKAALNMLLKGEMTTRQLAGAFHAPREKKVDYFVCDICKRRLSKSFVPLKCLFTNVISCNKTF